MYQFLSNSRRLPQPLKHRITQPHGFQRIWPALLLVLPILVGPSATAVEIVGSVKSISPDKREISIVRQVGGNMRTVTLHIDPSALTLITNPTGSLVELTFDPEEEVVTTIKLVSPAPTPKPSYPHTTTKKRRFLIQPNSLAGWTPLPKDSPLRWQVKGTTLVATGDGASIRTIQSYRDFKFHCEFLLSHRCNSGIFLRGSYEIAILDSAWRDRAGKLPPPTAQTGAIWGQTAPKQFAYKGSGKWNTMDVTLISNFLTVNLNGVDVLKNLKLFEPTQGGLPNQDPLFGPLIIQSHSNMRGTSFRNMWIEEL